MKKTTVFAALGGALLAATATQAFAQSSVTLYGIVDTALRYQTNANPGNDAQTQLGMGVVTPSRWGLKGSEDLGDGLSAVFRLESQFNLNDGTLSSTNGMFRRQAWVGLASKQYGTLSFGRQMSPLFDVMGNIYDPMTVGDYWQDSWVYNPVGPFLTQDSSVKYTGRFGGLLLEGMYGFGSSLSQGVVPGSVGKNSMYGVTASYAFGPLSLDAGFQQNDVFEKKFNIANVGAVYQFTPGLKFMAGWLHSQDNTGVVNSAEAQSSLALASTFGAQGNRIDDNFYVGSTWQATVPLSLTFAGYYGHARGAQTDAQGDTGSGTNYSATVLAEYALSKRTEVYGTVDFSRGTGAYQFDYPGRNNNLGVAVGLRNIF